MQKVSLIHQIFINEDMNLPEKMPEIMEYNSESLKFHFPDASYKMWNGEEIREFIASRFSKEVVDAYDLLRPYSYKCDLARYCVLKICGGLYADLAIRFVDHLELPEEIGLLAFKDIEFGSPAWFACNGGLIWAEKGRPEFDHAIEAVIANCRERFYGRNSLYPTGPIVWGRAIVEAAAGADRFDAGHDQWIGSMSYLYSHGAQPMGYFTPDRKLVALRAKKIGADLTHLGATGVNNYAVIWNERRVYGELGREWRHEKLPITQRAIRQKDGIAFAGGKGEIVTFGPYIELEEGDWRLSVIFDRAVPTPDFVLEAVSDNGRNLISKRTFPASQTPVQSLSIDFSIQQVTSRTEFRTRIFGPFEGLITAIRLEPNVQPVREDHSAATVASDVGVSCQAGPSAARSKETDFTTAKTGVPGRNCKRSTE